MSHGLAIPFGATPLHASSGDVAAAVAAATLAADANQPNWLTGFDFTGTGATGASTVVLTVTGLEGGVTMRFVIVVPAGAALAAPILGPRFPIPLKGVDNTAIVVSVPSLGAGNLHSCVNAYGYKCPK